MYFSDFGSRFRGRCVTFRSGCLLARRSWLKTKVSGCNGWLQSEIKLVS